MSKILPYILTTLIGFAVGIGAGIWTKHITCIPPPPGAMLDELKDVPIGSGNPAPAPAPDAQREEAYRQIRAEMDDFRQKVGEIKRSLRSQVEPILTPDQRTRMGRWRERPSAPPGSRTFWEGFDSAMVIMMVSFSLERMNDSLDLTPAQKDAVHKLLLERREKFLELVDTTPPPSFKIPKLAPPEAKTAKPGK
jgi:hypothetical protein